MGGVGVCMAGWGSAAGCGWGVGWGGFGGALTIPPSTFGKIRGIMLYWTPILRETAGRRSKRQLGIQRWEAVTTMSPFGEVVVLIRRNGSLLTDILMGRNSQGKVEPAGPLRLLVQLAPTGRCHQRHGQRYCFGRGSSSGHGRVIREQVAIQAADPLRLLPPESKGRVSFPTLRVWRGRTLRKTAHPSRLPAI